jgi:hypothetical protein
MIANCRVPLLACPAVLLTLLDKPAVAPNPAGCFRLPPYPFLAIHTTALRSTFRTFSSKKMG